jgi:hypothetical protein
VETTTNFGNRAGFLLDRVMQIDWFAVKTNWWSPLLHPLQIGQAIGINRLWVEQVVPLIDSATIYINRVIPKARASRRIGWSERTPNRGTCGRQPACNHTSVNKPRRCAFKCTGKRAGANVPIKAAADCAACCSTGCVGSYSLPQHCGCRICPEKATGHSATGQTGDRPDGGTGQSVASDLLQ